MTNIYSGVRVSPSQSDPYLSYFENEPTSEISSFKNKYEHKKTESENLEKKLSDLNHWVWTHRKDSGLIGFFVKIITSFARLMAPNLAKLKLLDTDLTTDAEKYAQAIRTINDRQLLRTNFDKALTKVRAWNADTEITCTPDEASAAYHTLFYAADKIWTDRDGIRQSYYQAAIKAKALEKRARKAAKDRSLSIERYNKQATLAEQKITTSTYSSIQEVSRLATQWTIEAAYASSIGATSAKQGFLRAAAKAHELAAKAHELIEVLNNWTFDKKPIQRYLTNVKSLF